MAATAAPDSGLQFCPERVSVRGMLRLIVVLLAVLCAGSVCAEEDETELAKKTQNPVADLISVPFQNNFNFGIGPRDTTALVLNVQPVIPFHLTDDWNLITRTITPIISTGSP